MLKDFIDFIKSSGLNPEIFFSSGCLDRMNTETLDGIVSMLGARQECSIHGPFMDLCPGAVDRKVRDVTVERLNHALDIAARLKPHSIVFHGGYEQWKFGHKIDEWLEGSLLVWPALIERAQRIGTRIVIENVFEHEPEPLAALMDRLGCMHFGVCFDIGHYNLFTKKPLSYWMDALGPHIMELHLHDNEGGYDAHLPMGEGDIKYEELFDRMRGRDLIYTMEVRSAEAAMKSRKYIEKLL